MKSRPDAAERRRAWSYFEEMGLPTASDEVWRYAPLGELGLERFSVPIAPSAAPDSDFARQLSLRAGVVIRVVDGFCVSTGEPVEGVVVEVDDTNESLAGGSLSRRYESDSFALLNAALAPSTTVIRVAEGVNIAQPIVVLNESKRRRHLPAYPDRASGPVRASRSWSTSRVARTPSSCP